MRQIFEKFKTTFIIALAMVLPLSSFAFQPKDGFKKGSIELKDGQVLTGEVLPLANFNETSTLFKGADGVQKTIAFNTIKKVMYGEKELVTGTAKINGRSTSVYLQVLEKGTATLYKAYFYSAQTMGKNNSVSAFQESWMVSTPLNGLTVLGKNPSEKQLAKALDHPAMNLSAETKKLQSEADLIQWIQNYNSMALSMPTPSNEIND
jgi:hypothetical protein